MLVNVRNNFSRVFLDSQATSSSCVFQEISFSTHVIEYLIANKNGFTRSKSTGHGPNDERRIKSEFFKLSKLISMYNDPWKKIFHHRQIITPLSPNKMSCIITFYGQHDNFFY